LQQARHALRQAILALIRAKRPGFSQQHSGSQQGSGSQQETASQQGSGSQQGAGSSQHGSHSQQGSGASHSHSQAHGQSQAMAVDCMPDANSNNAMQATKRIRLDVFIFRFS
jgi:hypothetical protein